MQLSLFLHHHHHPMLLHNYCPLNSLHFTRTQTRLYNRNSYKVLPCNCSYSSSSSNKADIITSKIDEGRRALLSCLLITTFSGVYACDDAEAVSTSRRALRGAKIPETDFTTLPNGLKYYDLKVGQGAEAVKGSRVAVHYVAKWRGITFMTSRQGMGVGGGTPYGFDVGESERGNVLKGLDLGVQGMRVGGQRLLIVPPELAYGKKGVQEIPPNATIELDVELLSIKQSPFGTAVKIVEG
ncbi:peptidyl-prolyl cis-trans isomerase FKBP16-4, chloroplastic isoform X2 [Arachis duranensis]|uniref:peptidylprolyl isomerase n=1 Tax=Arachis duranensis TaxID=130453 RepID=A0A6P4CJ58_ARADU|nr:peptidyl-prolyl cis-trans isomerase FKBP16-4, chloroplastic isoform X2 [Arachis duranensis]XP_025635024.1 peptidyl-prolyl cis-trans isomerase FKBP16-4, chloroplastic-like isoform X6 [Arachis hypogaea]XP_025663816.1 peptidyl-prolyl cis-trans isomerase FKBP16-4, chloroplastic-like isoform X6 [Arachis hypogaea]XP_057742906.1 peptidyl-prolyl cis-trans isomerase FKBP16-4, chloroplastic-like isoform X2 [Arachis stenosperma]